jgi:UDP-glucuronate 4-epimerase
MKVLVTGTAGFIGFHVAETLLKRGDEVVGLDVINDYYELRLKYGRLEKSGILEEMIVPDQLVQSKVHPKYRFIKADLANRDLLMELFKNEQFDVVVNLAAQAGVRYSLTNPQAYLHSNFTGFFNLLEACRNFPVKHLVYASSSSVYGLNEHMPFSEKDGVNHPISLYAASKKSNELMAHTYSHLFRIPSTGLRFFTVYGPWGRPDMALFLFTRSILEGKPIQVFNDGNMQRDFTYIDDIVQGVIKVIDSPAKANDSWNGAEPDPSASSAPYRVYNIGNSAPVKLMDFIKALEIAIGKEAVKDYQPLQMGDVLATWADTSQLQDDLGYKPTTSVDKGVKLFVDWYKTFYK